MFRRYTLFDEMFSLMKELDDLRQGLLEESRPFMIDPIGPRRLLPAAPLRGEFLPTVECFLRDDQLVFRAELPGVDPADLEVSVKGGRLCIRGEKKDDHNVDQKDLFFREISRGRFERSFSLPEGVKADRIKASFSNGVLEVSMPAGTSQPARKVPIETPEAGKKAVKVA